MHVPAVGPKDAKIMIVGEAPGEQEERKGMPFVGPAGKLLDECLHDVGILRSMCYITNTIKERPYRNDITPYLDLNVRGKNLPKESHAYLVYRNQLKAEIEEVRPNVVVAVGAVALWALCGKLGITKWRGSILESTLVPGQKVIPIIHPAGALQGKYNWRHYIKLDLARVRKQSATPEIKLDSREYIIAPGFKEAIEYIRECQHSRRFAFDIEVSGRELSCISLSFGKRHAISIPFTEGTDLYWRRDQEAYILREIAKALEDPTVESLGHNTTFDATFLFHKYRIRSRNLHDTMVAQAINYPEFEKDLGFLTSVYTDIPYYKDEGKEKFKRGVDNTVSDRDFWLYNAKDSIVLMETFPKQLKELAKLGNTETYDFQRRCIPPLIFLYARGIKMQTNAMKNASMEAEAKLIRLENDLNTIVGYPINANSSKQLIDWFYIKKKAKRYHNRKTGSLTVDEGALKRLKQQDDPEIAIAADIILDSRSEGKMKSTYLDMKLDEDGRLRCSMNPVGTRFGRFSSSKTIFGTGANMQNQPPSMKKYMLPDDGYVAYNVDLSQAENRVVAYYGPDELMTEAFYNGIDIHSLTASNIARFYGYDLDASTIKEWDGLFESTGDKEYASPIGNFKHSWRYWGKKANHSLNYDYGFRSFAYLYEIPERDAKLIIEAYHQTYPGVRQYHRRVQEALKRNRTLENLLGRKKLFLDRWGDELFKAGYSFIPQSTVADIINRRGIIFLYERQDLFPELELLNQVHDSIVFQIPISVGWKRHAEMILTLKHSLETPLAVHGRQFTIPADFKLMPKNFAKGAEFKGAKWKKDWNDPATFADALAEAYEKEMSHA